MPLHVLWRQRFLELVSLTIGSAATNSLHSSPGRIYRSSIVIGWENRFSHRTELSDSRAPTHYDQLSSRWKLLHAVNDNFCYLGRL
jgi:hypothetical protein